MKHETLFWGRIVEALWKPDRLLNRIENGVLDGMPDSYLCMGGVMNWMELKCPSEPARANTALFSGSHKLSIGQRNWLLAHRQAGGRGWIAVETANWVFLIGAQHSDEINKATVAQLQQLATFSARRPMKNAWIEFEAALNDRSVLP